MAENTKQNKLKKFMESKLFATLLPIIFLVLLVAVFGVLTGGRFLKLTSLKIILNQALIVGTVATGAAFIYATGNVNLAMGATSVLTATLAGMAYNATGSFFIMIVVALVLGIALMAFSAILSTLLGVRVMFVTIVMMSLFASLQQSILGGSTVSISYDLISRLQGNGFMYIAFGLYFAICFVIFNYTDIGRSVKMLGTNKVCAEQTGISFSKYLLTAFIIAGVGCAIGALLIIVRAGSIGQNTMSSLNMDCMLAMVLGGMSIFGGSKSYVHAGIIGSLTVCVLNQGLLMIGVDSTIIQAVRGIIFLVLVCTSQVRPKGLPAPEG